MAMKKKVSPAWALEPVIVFTQIDSTSSITESPNIDAVSPAYRRVKPGWRKACLTRRQLLPRPRVSAARPGRSRGAPHATNSHNREPGGRSAVSVDRSAYRSRTDADLAVDLVELVEGQPAGVLGEARRPRPTRAPPRRAAGHAPAGTGRPGAAGACPRGRGPRAARRAWRPGRPMPGPTDRTRHGRCRPIPPPASSTKEWSASLRRCHEQLAGVSSSRSASSVAVSGPSTVSSSMIPSRTGWASAASSRGSLSRRYDGPCCCSSPAASSGAWPVVSTVPCVVWSRRAPFLVDMHRK